MLKPNHDQNKTAFECEKLLQVKAFRIRDSNMSDQTAVSQFLGHRVLLAYSRRVFVVICLWLLGIITSISHAA